MRRMIYSFVMAIFCSSAVFAGQSPASLEVISGPVFVDQGHGLVEADRFTLLNANDRILMKVGSTALLINNKLGCTISLRDAGLYQVPDMTNCHSGQASVLQSDITISPATSPLAPGGFISTGSGVASQSGVFFGVGFFGITGIAAATNTILEDEPVSNY
jgi:hypothetical protein